MAVPPEMILKFAPKHRAPGMLDEVGEDFFRLKLKINAFAPSA